MGVSGGAGVCNFVYVCACGRYLLLRLVLVVLAILDLRHQQCGKLLQPTFLS